MIYLWEQIGYKRSGCREIEEDKEVLLAPVKEKICRRTVNRQGKDALCLCVDYDTGKGQYHFETSYFVGIDWIIENKIAAYVQPKQNDGKVQVDYIQMLVEALHEPENLNHLDDLLTIRFDQPSVPVRQCEDLLSPFLIIQYLYLLRAIVRKGLKRSYYPVTENLESKVKGKILVNQTVRKNIVKGIHTRTVCCYECFGLNGDENRILKKAYIFACRAIHGYPGIKGNILEPLIHYICPAFEAIDENIRTDRIKSFRPNPLYKEYEQALKLAQLILKRYSYNINQTENQFINTPPFWIDMSKLFELYVFKKLRLVFPGHNEVIYHLKVNRKELDYIVNATDPNGNELKLVVDAKYKPRYNEDKISTKDIRQVAGYARMRRVYEELKLENELHRNIPCLIIYPHQTATDLFTQESLLSDDKRDPDYVDMYKVGIRLPVV